jgi:CBS domain-containing protein
MSKGVICVDSSRTVLEALQVMERHDIDTLVVKDTKSETPRVLASWRIRPTDLGLRISDLNLPVCQVVTRSTRLADVKSEIASSSLVAVKDLSSSDLIGVVTAFDLAK